MLDPRFENVAAEEVSAIRCIHRNCADLAADHDWHFHPQYEITWFLRSSGTRYVGDSIERYAGGDLVLSGPNLPHCWRNDVGTDAERPEWIAVQFDRMSLGEDFLALPEASALRGLLAEAASGVRYGRETAEFVGPVLQDLCRQQGLLRTVRLAEVLTLLADAPRTRLATTAHHRNNTVDQAMMTRLARVTRFVSERFRGTASQAELARELDMSAASFSKFVRAATGETFTAMVKLARINEACRLLASSDDSITSIALDCGYQHTSHFNFHFAGLKGMTPTEYRRRMRKLSVDSETAGQNPASRTAIVL